jgi:hypothetical protein
MILSDRDIKMAIATGRVKVEFPLGASQAAKYVEHIHASSMDFHLGNSFKLYEHSKFAVIDPRKPETFTGNMRMITIPDDEPYMVQPGEFVLGVTQEIITIPDDLNDLNACYSMEAMLNPDEEEEFLTFLGAYNHDSEATWNACHATATERCEAFLRVKNLWKD